MSETAITLEPTAGWFADKYMPNYPSSQIIGSGFASELEMLPDDDGWSDHRDISRLLIIDADTSLVPKHLRQVFPGPAYRVVTARTGIEGLKRVNIERPDVILLDLHLPDQSGLEVYRSIRKLDSRIPVIFVTTTRASDVAIKAIMLGAYDYLFKPLNSHQLRRVVGKALEVSRQMRDLPNPDEIVPEPEVEGAIIGNCPAMLEVYKSIGRVADQAFPVLITGESGTGKELVARAIYQHSSALKARSWPSTARLFRKTCWRASCSGTRRRFHGR